MADRPRVLLTRRLPTDLERRLEASVLVTRREADSPPSEAELLELVPGHDAVICMLTEPITDRVLASPGLRLVSQVAVGLDNIDLDAARRRGIVVAHTPGVLTDATADLAMALLLSTARRLPEAERVVRDGRWATWSLDMLTGLELRGAVLGIVGLGRIGQAVAGRAQAFGMTIRYAAPRRADAEVEAALGAEHVPLERLLAESDVVSLHAPLKADTHHLLSRARLFAMKPGAILVNTARGGLVEEDALADALERGPLRWAALDVFADEPRVPSSLLGRDDVILLPHIGSATTAARHAMARLATEAVLDWCAGRPVAHRAG